MNDKIVKGANPYKLKSRNVSRIYWKIILYSLIATVAWGILGAIPMVKILSNIYFAIGFVCIFVPAIWLILLFPYICYIIYLRKRARIYQEEQEAKLEAGSDGDEYISQLQEIEYSGHGNNDYGPWWGLFVILFILPPVGLYMIMIKAFSDHKKYLENAVVLENVGMTISVAGILLDLLHIYIYKDAGPLPIMLYYICIMPTLSGFIMYVTGKMIHKKGLKIAKCQRFVLVHGVLNLEELGNKLGSSYVDTVRTVGKYINRGYLSSCFIDYQKRTLVAPEQYPKVAVKCKYCGSTTVKLKGTTSVCDYCGRNI